MGELGASSDSFQIISNLSGVVDMLEGREG